MEAIELTADEIRKELDSPILEKEVVKMNPSMSK
jgi:hypothetical protein